MGVTHDCEGRGRGTWATDSAPANSLKLCTINPVQMELIRGGISCKPRVMLVVTKKRLFSTNRASDNPQTKSG